MTDPREAALSAHLQRSLAAMQRAAADPALRGAILASAQAIARALRAGGKVMLAGNGGSAADAQHIAAEFLSRFRRERAPMAAMALTTDTSVLTAIGNDFGFEAVFARQVHAHGRKGDVLIAISTSGRSPNIIAALEAARAIGVVGIGFTGMGGDMAARCDIVLAAPGEDTALVQQLHIVAAHAICGLVEDDIAGLI
ncbi:MAG: SIS domain-containing protein [Proteobacteria bacterium]|nr:SIS domain-containing protein [Pseudomonadota bacterium]